MRDSLRSVIHTLFPSLGSSGGLCSGRLELFVRKPVFHNSQRPGNQNLDDPLYMALLSSQSRRS
ncbi:hypothetical protein Mapa_009226 [Marchantia paleacea]|nr:hypothetical protein Mapa_009226 [Marchantia paleacea]